MNWARTSIASGACGNKAAAQLIQAVRITVEQGNLLSSALVHQTLFDPMLLDLLQAGEKTGKVDELLHFAADYFDDEIRTTLDNLTAILEPLLMLFLGVVVGGIVVCIFLPIFRLPGVIS